MFIVTSSRSQSFAASGTTPFIFRFTVVHALGTVAVSSGVESVSSFSTSPVVVAVVTVMRFFVVADVQIERNGYDPLHSIFAPRPNEVDGQSLFDTREVRCGT